MYHCWIDQQTSRTTIKKNRKDPPNRRCRTPTHGRGWMRQVNPSVWLSAMPTEGACNLWWSLLLLLCIHRLLTGSTNEVLYYFCCAEFSTDWNTHYHSLKKITAKLLAKIGLSCQYCEWQSNVYMTWHLRNQLLGQVLLRNQHRSPYYTNRKLMWNENLYIILLT